MESAIKHRKRNIVKTTKRDLGLCLGATVYLYAYLSNSKINSKYSFLCKGIIVNDGPVLQVIIVAINNFAPGQSFGDRHLRDLLGKRLPRQETQLYLSISEITQKLYQQGSWLAWPPAKITKITAKYLTVSQEPKTLQTAVKTTG